MSLRFLIALILTACGPISAADPNAFTDLNLNIKGSE